MADIITFTTRVEDNSTSGVNFEVYDSSHEKWDKKTATWEFQVNTGQEINSTYKCVSGKNSEHRSPGSMSLNCSLLMPDGNASVSILYSVIDEGDNGPAYEGIPVPGFLLLELVAVVIFFKTWERLTRIF